MTWLLEHCCCFEECLSVPGHTLTACGGPALSWALQGWRGPNRDGVRCQRCCFPTSVSAWQGKHKASPTHWLMF